MSRAPGEKPLVLVILGSLRAGRVCEKIGRWVVDVALASTECAFEIVDLHDWPLPMDDEPGIPARGVYVFEHTKAWSRKIAAGDAFVFVTPQYNGGYPAPLKNAVDHLYAEWRGKAVVIVSYGNHGGGRCAKQFRQIVEGMKMRPVETMPAIVLTDAMVDGGPVDPPRDFAAHIAEVQTAMVELAAAIEPVV